MTLRSPIRAPIRRKQASWTRWLPIVADAAKLVASLRERPRAIDWLAVAARAAALGAQVRAQHRAQLARSAWSYFDDDGPHATWVEVPEEFRSLVLRHAEGLGFDDAHWDGEYHSERVVLGHVEGHPIGWIQSAGEPNVVDGPYVRRSKQDETFAAVGRAVWASHDTKHVSFGPAGLVRDRFVVDDTRRSAQASRLLARVAAFRANGHARSVLLVGAPGTGKSHALRSIAHGLGLTTLRVELAALVDEPEGPSVEEVREGLDTLVKMLDPQAVILDDIDRVGTDVRLLRFLEEAAAVGRIVLASANGTSTMLGALLRPGRFDEVVRYERLDRALLESMLGPQADLADRLQELPMAYVREFIARVDVLGRQAAVAELAGLEERAKATSSAS